MGQGAGPSFPNKISNPATAPSLSLRSLQGQDGELDLASSTHGDQNPRPFGFAQGRLCRKRRDKSGAPSMIKMRKGWASPLFTLYVLTRAYPTPTPPYPPTPSP
jgi:hypothetical protein